MSGIPSASGEPRTPFATADESFLSSLSVIAATWNAACQYCDTRDVELVLLANGRSGAAITHRPHCPYAG